MKKEVILAAKTDDMAVIQKMPNFTDVYNYHSTQFLHAHQREFGKITTPDVDYKILLFTTESLFDLKCVWSCKEKTQELSIAEDKDNNRIVYVNWVDSRVAHLAVSALIQWLIEKTNNTWPPNFRIWTGKHLGRDAIFASFDPEKRKNEST